MKAKTKKPQAGLLAISVKRLFQIRYAKTIIFVLVVFAVTLYYYIYSFSATNKYKKHKHEESGTVELMAMEMGNIAGNKNPGDGKGSTYSPAGNKLANEEGLRQREAKIVKEGSLSLKVESVTATVEKVVKMTKQQAGYVESQNIRRDYQKKLYAELYLRIPPAKLEKIVQTFAKLGEIEDQLIRIKNITQEYHAIDISLKNKLALRARYLQLLQKKANKVSEIIGVEKEINNLTNEIETLQDTMNHYDKWLSYSTLAVKLYEPESIFQSSSPRPPIVQKIGKSFVDAFYLFIDLLNFVIISLGVILPLLLSFFLIQKFIGHRKVKNMFKR